MARTSKYTKEDLISAAMGLVRGGGFENLSARTLTKALGATAATIFTHFNSMDELNREIMVRIRKQFDEYIQEGLSMNPPFKGLAYQLFQFAKAYPQYFKILFFDRKDFVNINSILNTVGHLEEVKPYIKDTFGLDDDQAVWVYQNLIIYALGITSLIVAGNKFFDDETLADNMSRMARALVKEAKQGSDSLTQVIPSKDLVLNDQVKDFLGE